MIEQFIQGRTSVFVDASNIYHSCQAMGFYIDYKKLLFYLQERSSLIKGYFYTALLPGNQKQKRFLDWLEIIGYKIRKKPIKEIGRPGKFLIQKGNMDVELTIDAIDTLKDYDHFMLLSGDGDFTELLKYLKRRGKKVTVMSTEKAVAHELRREGNYIDLKTLREKIEYRKIPQRGIFPLRS